MIIKISKAGKYNTDAFKSNLAFLFVLLNARGTADMENMSDSMNTPIA